MHSASNIDTLHPDWERPFYEGVTSKRLVAWFIDLFVIAVLFVPVLLITGLMTLGLGFIAAPLVLTAVAFLYRTVTIAGGSATWGMAAMGIEFRQKNGQRFDLTHATVHTVIHFALMASVIGWLINCVAMLISERGQGIGDLLLGSNAINKAAE